MKAVKLTMMAVAAGMVMASPAWAVPSVDGVGHKTAELNFSAPAGQVKVDITAKDGLTSGAVAADTALADVSVKQSDAGNGETLAVAWTPGYEGQTVDPAGLKADIQMHEGETTDVLHVKLNMTGGGAMQPIDGEDWIPSTATGAYVGTIDADAGNTAVKAGVYNISLDGAVYTA